MFETNSTLITGWGSHILNLVKIYGRATLGMYLTMHTSFEFDIYTQEVFKKLSRLDCALEKNNDIVDKALRSYLANCFYFYHFFCDDKNLEIFISDWKDNLWPRIRRLTLEKETNLQTFEIEFLESQDGKEKSLDSDFVQNLETYANTKLIKISKLKAQFFPNFILNNKDIFLNSTRLDINFPTDNPRFNWVTIFGPLHWTWLHLVAAEISARNSHTLCLEFLHFFYSYSKFILCPVCSDEFEMKKSSIMNFLSHDDCAKYIEIFLFEFHNNTKNDSKQNLSILHSYRIFMDEKRLRLLEDPLELSDNFRLREPEIKEV